MTVITKSALVPYTAEEMFVLVADIDRYGEFLPWCGGASILERGEATTVATIRIAYGAVQQSFTTRNELTPGRLMRMELVDGPFRQLTGHWQFDPLAEQASKVALRLEFEFASRLVGLAIGPAFERIANSLVDSFRTRAETLYGRRTG